MVANSGPGLPWSLAFVPAVDGAVLAVRLAFDATDGSLTATLVNEGAETARPRALSLVADPAWPAAGGSAWLHGRYMQMDALVHSFGAEPAEAYDGRYRRELPGGGWRYLSHEQLALGLPAKATPALFAGCLRPDRFFLDFLIDVDAEERTVERLEARFDLEGMELGAGETFALPPLWLRDGYDPWALAERYADDVAGTMGARVPRRPPTGWCSWYFFGDRVGEADVLANLQAAGASGFAAGVVQIDDGYQSRTGDWLTPNERFPGGMAALAGRIREAGYRPGLWLAPFLLHEESDALRERPTMALRDREGEPFFVDSWLGRCAVVDCTTVEGEAWLQEVVDTIVARWGYSYLKLDALAFAAVSSASVRYARTGTTAAGHLRRGLEIIRAAAGEETFLLACTCHFGPAIGLVDGMRVGPDVRTTWADGPNPSVRHALRLALQRNWMHGRWWTNDPDCLVLRERDSELSETEVRFLATGVALSGGMVVDGDDLPALSAGRRELLLAMTPPTGRAARPADPWEAPVASAWRAELDDGRSVVGMLNWSDVPRWVPTAEQLRPGEVAFDCLEGRLVGMGDRLLRPHEGALWQVAAPGPTPRVVGDSASLTYEGLYQRPVSGRIQVGNDLARSRTIAVEARGQVFEADLDPGERRWFD
ncbi:MAG: alpha-galactosidase [Dehalococcoidia bacterium]|nr:alpha-galactosidase [Dehalococcoidia bacterium]